MNEAVQRVVVWGVRRAGGGGRGGVAVCCGGVSCNHVRHCFPPPEDTIVRYFVRDEFKGQSTGTHNAVPKKPLLATTNEEIATVAGGKHSDTRGRPARCETSQV